MLPAARGRLKQAPFQQTPTVMSVTRTDESLTYRCLARVEEVRGPAVGLYCVSRIETLLITLTINANCVVKVIVLYSEGLPPPFCQFEESASTGDHTLDSSSFRPYPIYHDLLTYQSTDVIIVVLDCSFSDSVRFCLSRC